MPIQGKQNVLIMMTDSVVKSHLSKSGEPGAGRQFLARFEHSYSETQGVSFDWDKPQAKRILSIFGNSAALAEKLIKNPHFGDELIKDKSWDLRKNRKDLQDELSRVAAELSHDDIPACQKLIRHFKYLQMIRIVARDLSSPPPVKDILLEWSDTADCLIGFAYDWALQTMINKFGRPQYLKPDGKPADCLGSVVALGKLGGRELNMSSDVDLLCLYTSDSGGAQNHEFFTRVITLFTRLLSAITEDGFAFRVDHDLRPEGPTGPMVNSLEALERYYETFGRDWERIALIRARPVAGDTNLGELFKDIIRPFVFRTSLSLTELAHLRDMKFEMESEARMSAVKQDLKIGPGGIRELEFLIQALQQVFAGHIKDIRIANIFDAIAALKDKNILHPDGAAFLHDAYSFLRRAENMLQIANDRQTHAIPDSKKEIAALACRMGLPCEKMISEWRRHTGLVRRLFTALFEADYEKIELEEAMAVNLATCKTDEERLDALAWFKNQETRRLVRLDLASKIKLPELLMRLSLIAEVVLNTALKLAYNALLPRFGEPLQEDQSPALFAIVGFGRLGSSEMDYGSDLDLCFLYSGDGATSGPEKISLSWFFTKLSQRITTLISTHSRYGRVYPIDSDLRPSGGQGSLVASLESFKNYHLTKSKIWERQALLKARAVAGDVSFCKQVQNALNELAYTTSLPHETQISEEIASLRKRFELEASGENENTVNLKIGYGGIADLESILQFLQLKNARFTPELRIKNSFEIIKVLHKLSFITDCCYDIIYQKYELYRFWIARLRLFTNSTANLVDFRAPYIESLSRNLGFETPEVFRQTIKKHRQEVRKFYMEFFSKTLQG